MDPVQKSTLSQNLDTESRIRKNDDPLEVNSLGLFAIEKLKAREMVKS